MVRLFASLLLICAGFYGFAQKDITLDDIYKKGTFRIKSVPGFNALKDGKRYTQLDAEQEGATIRIYDLKTGRQGEVLFRAGDHLIGGKPLPVESYTFSEDERKILLFTEGEAIYRRSYLFRVYVYDLKEQKLEPLLAEKVLHASFSPDGKYVAFVLDNNVCYKSLANGNITAVTTDGRKNEVINGNCDWVYEEEFEFTKAFEWAPDGKHLAYYRFDERSVPEFSMTIYDSLYPTEYRYKYPKTGAPNSIIQIRIYDLENEKTVTCDVKDAKAGTDFYVPRIRWTKNPNQLCVYKLNRHQNHLELLLANAHTGRTQVIYDERNKYYVDINDNLTFLPDRRSFVFSSERSGYHHFYRYDWKERELTPLTKGNYDVDALIGVDEKQGLIFYTAAKNPVERKLYAVDFEGEERQLLTPEAGTHSITRIEGFQYFLDKHSTLSQPPVFYLRDRKGKIVRTLEDNAALVATMKEYRLGQIRFREFPGVNGVKLNAWTITPPDFDKQKKYPVLMYQYSGPGSQEVADRFPIRDFFWHQMLAQKGYIIVCVDGTGTGYRGEVFKKKTYRQLGKLESDDQIAVARHLATLPYVDAQRIGIWGWSFGGFMSSACMFKAGDVFKAGIAVAPVTNWRYYDNIYTERFMRTPQENPEGYDDNAPEKMVAGLKGKYLLIHGTADDNVHVQNAMSLIDALIKADKDFDSEMYPNKNHGIYGGNTRSHLYRRMTEFILKNL